MTRPALLLLLALAGGCRSHPDADEPAGSMHAEWFGLDTGKVDGAARANWCAADQRLEIFGVKGDAGVGLVVYPAEELGPGYFVAFDPGLDTVHRPGVSGALRWFSERAIAGYQSDSGGLELTRAGSGYSGTFEFRMRPLNGDDTLRLRGRFRRVSPAACPGDSLSPPPDSD